MYIKRWLILFFCSSCSLVIRLIIRKSIRLVVDVSGSMYRFNGYDGRLDRTLEAVLMVMEAFEAYHTKFKVLYSEQCSDKLIMEF